MNVGGTHYRSIWLGEDGTSVEAIDQTLLPHAFEVVRMRTVDDAAAAIRTMVVRGAPLIGATAAYGMWLATLESATLESAALESATLESATPESAASDRLRDAAALLISARPTAVNLRWAVDRMLAAIEPLPRSERAAAAREEATAIADEDVRANERIAEHGFDLLSRLAPARGGRPLSILTHCNAGWLATVDWGTALAPVFRAHDAGVPVHVWVDETRPRNQGSALTAWELGQHGVAHTIVTDNAGGHLMQRGLVDACIVGSDRTAVNGDVCNKIGTYLKALAAFDNDVPFYVALPGSTIDWRAQSSADIVIEERSPDEVSHVHGVSATGERSSVRVAPSDSPVANPAFDVTPARLVSGLITERGVCSASHAGISSLFPDLVPAPWPETERPNTLVHTL